MSNKRSRRQSNIISNNLLQDSQNDVPLTLEQLEQVMQFSQVIFNAYSDKAVSTFTPMLTSDRLASISFLPKDMSVSQLKDAFASPIAHKEIITSYATWLKFTDSVSSRTANYIGNLAAFDMNYVCINPPKNRKDSEYLESLDKLKQFFNKFDYKGEFSKIARRMVVEDAYFGLFRTDMGDKYTFQELPSNRCLITAKSPDYGFIYDFDVSWFLEQGISLDQYPKSMKDAFNRVYANKEKRSEKYTPANKLNDRDATFSTWTQTSPLISKGGFTCFKFNSDTFEVMPFLATLFNDAINKDIIRELQNNQYIIASQKILVGLIPMLKEQKSGQVRDAVAIDPNTLATYLGFLKKGLNQSIKISGVPFADLKDVHYDLPQKNMYNDYTINLAAGSGVTSRLVHASDKMTATELKYSVNIDEMISTQIYPQFSNWATTIVNSLTGKYKFKIMFGGSNFWDSRKERFDYAGRLADRGMFIPQLFASSLGYNPFDFMEMLADSKNSNIQDLMQLPMNTNTKDYGEQGNDSLVEDTPADSSERDDDFGGE